MPFNPSGSKRCRCQHKSSVLCSSCQQEKIELHGLGSWPTELNPTRVPLKTLVEDNRDAFPRSTKSTTQAQAQQRSQSKKPTQQPTANTKSHHQLPDNGYTSSTLAYHQQPKPITPTSSVATTRGGSPVTHHATPALAYHSRQAQPATTNAGGVARGYPRAMTTQTESQVLAHMERMRIAAANNFEESETDSDDQSGDSSDDDDDD